MTEHKTLATTPAGSGQQDKQKQRDTAQYVIQNVTQNGARVNVTVLTSESQLTKTFDIKDGELKKQVAAQLYNGSAKIVELADFRGLQLLLEGLTSKQAIMLGQYDADLHGANPKVVTRKAKEKQFKDDNNVITRTKDTERTLGYFAWSTGAGVILLDNDRGSSLSYLRDLLSEVMPELDNVALLQRSSTSANIFDKDDKELKGMTGSHGFLPASDMTLIDKFKELLEHRLWLTNHGHIFIDKAGGRHSRTTFDLAVFSPERLVFEGSKLNGGLTQKRDTFFRDGEVLDISQLPSVTDAERESVVALKQAAKGKALPKSKKKKQVYIKAEMEKIMTRDSCDAETARVIVNSRLERALVGSDTVTLEDDTVVSVSTMLTEQEKYEGITCYDPIEPDYDGGRVVAIFYPNMDSGSPHIFSQAHGGRTFTMSFDFKSLMGVLKSMGGSNTDRLKTNWKRLIRLSKLEADELDVVLNEVKAMTGIRKQSLIVSLASYKRSRRADSEPKQMELMDISESVMSNTILLPVMKPHMLVVPDVVTLYEYTGGGLWEVRSAEDLNKKVKDYLVDKWGDGADYTHRYWASCCKILINSLRISHKEMGRLMSMNREHRYVPFKNGVFDVTDGVLRDHDRDMFFRWRLPYEWVKPDIIIDLCGWNTFFSIAPKFNKLLLGQLDDHGRAVLIACIKATLMGRADLQFYVEMVGSPGSGKSTLVHVIRALIGEGNVTDTSLRAIEENNFEVAKLRDKKAAFFADANWFAKSISMFKAITGHDHVSIEMKHVQQKGAGVQLDVILWMLMNKALITPDTSTAMERRKVPLYTKKLWAGEDDPHLADDIIAEELPQIFNCIMAMPDKEMVRLIKNPACPMKRRNFLETNVVGWFVDEMLVADAGSNIQIGGYNTSENDMLFPAYQNWCNVEGTKPTTIPTFIEYLKKAVEVLMPECQLGWTKPQNKSTVNGLAFKKSKEDTFFLCS